MTKFGTKRMWKYSKTDPFAKKSLARDVRTVKRKVARLARMGELKWLDTPYSAVTFNNTASIVLLNGISQGVTVITREGNLLYPTSLQVKLKISMPSVSDALSVLTTTKPIRYRMLVIHDKQPNGAIFTVADLFDQTAGANDTFNPYNRNYSKRFRIVYDRIYNSSLIEKSATDLHQYKSGSITVRKRLRRNGPIKYIGTGNTISSIGTGSLWLVLLGESSNITMTANGLVRWYFKED